MDYQKLTALIIFGITYTGIIFTRLPGMNIDRPSAAFFGAVAMVASGILGFDQAILAIDFNTIGLLLGMMIIITTLQMDGFFALIATHAISWSATRRRLLVIIVWITGISSAFLVNDAVVLLFTPIIISICRKGRLNPLPYLIAEILASNIGSAMTITGNPQNMLIGINSGLSYSEFLLRLLPVSVAGMAIIAPVIRLLFPDEFRGNQPVKVDTSEFHYKLRTMRFSIPVFLLVIVLFFSGNITGLSIPMIALVGAALMMLLAKEKPSEIIRQVDWVLLLFFVTLFIVVHGLEATGLISQALNRYSLQETTGGLGFIHVVSLIMSQIVSNVPFTVLMLPMMKTANSEILWLTLASASTLAGNATIIGAMANLIVIQSAGKSGIHISFKNFFIPGIFVTLLTFIISFLVLYGQLIFFLS
ncbi:MAG TPA: anion transporter [Bacteroidales bacterium]|nr:MAG: hypothetical protein A2X11_05185 [Bacteroidetes bacterium GWE2_42_24]OFY26589.1 MAG: hypothetical protein A2X09_03385 [Bacteroidetes bacterium GWF2_43_11]HAQ65982.1 anion transporter [Bacteroidales bacterium]HBZ67468.1 anion transporter [Bacteroidales bacterium]